MQAQATLTNPIIANIFDGHAALCPSYKSNDVNQIASLTRQEILGDMFYTGSMGYFAQLNALTHIAAISSNAHYQLASGYGTFGYEPNVDYLFGMPIGIRAGGISLDIPINVITATNDGNKENKKNFKIQTGLLMSALEHSTPEQMFNDPANPTEAISAVKALQKASAAGQRIYQITQANIDSVMPNLNLGAGSEQEIIASVSAGLEVITHTDQVSVPGYTGEGYIILDPETGDGAYKIGGGGNGGEIDEVGITDFMLAVVKRPGLLITECESSLLEHAIKNFIETNKTLIGYAAPIGLSTLSGAAVAESTGGLTLLSALRLSMVESSFIAGNLLVAAMTTFINTILVNIAFEAGVLYGSFISAAICRRK